MTKCIKKNQIDSSISCKITMIAYGSCLQLRVQPGIYTITNTNTLYSYISICMRKHICIGMNIEQISELVYNNQDIGIGL